MRISVLKQKKHYKISRKICSHNKIKEMIISQEVVSEDNLEVIPQTNCASDHDCFV